MKVDIFADEHNEKYLLTLLEEQGYFLPCHCHGQHHCNGNQYSFDCSLIPKKPITIDFTPFSAKNTKVLSFQDKEIEPGFGDSILLDLGTTTIVIALIEKKTGKLRQISTAANRLSCYGTDIVSRIHASCHGKRKTMQQLLNTFLKEEIQKLCIKNNQSEKELLFCYIGGNTTMIHLLMGYDCTPLSVSPFHIKESSPSPFRFNNCTVIIAPWLSAFIGGDIVAGIHACNMTNTHETSLLLDIGTNGEIVLVHNRTLYASSVAAGSAFEAGNLQCGCAGIPGAIEKVTLRPVMPILKTIDNKLPIGICGSGAISLCAELLRHNYVTREGILSERFPVNGYLLSTTVEKHPIVFTANDLRQVQLAVSAIAAGIDSLCAHVGITAESVSHVYLGGGFGFHISWEDSSLLGLFSNLQKEAIHICGNTCLQGLYYCATKDLPFSLPLPVQIINFANDSYFQQKFLEHLTFPLM